MEQLGELERRGAAIILPPAGLPVARAGERLPEDVADFYRSCGGATVFPSGVYLVSVVPPSRFVPANPLILGAAFPEDISFWWYAVAEDGNGDYLTMDLHPDRAGRCYDSHHETHALRGSTPIIAVSFADLLERLIANGGGYPYWLRPDWQSLGDAYD
jgi:antitoxin YokJ